MHTADQVQAHCISLAKDDDDGGRAGAGRLSFPMKIHGQVYPSCTSTTRPMHLLRVLLYSSIILEIAYICTLANVNVNQSSAEKNANIASVKSQKFGTIIMMNVVFELDFHHNLEQH